MTDQTALQSLTDKANACLVRDNSLELLSHVAAACDAAHRAGKTEELGALVKATGNGDHSLFFIAGPDGSNESFLLDINANGNIRVFDVVDGRGVTIHRAFKNRYGRTYADADPMIVDALQVAASKGFEPAKQKLKEFGVPELPSPPRIQAGPVLRAKAA